MSDPFDDQIRDALRAEAEGITADEALLERVRRAVPTSRSARRSLAPWLLAAAAVAAVVGVAGILLTDDGDETLDVVDDPSTTTTPLDITELLPPASDACTQDGSLVLVVYMAPAAEESTDVATMGARLQQALAAGEAGITSIDYVDQPTAYLEVKAHLADRPELLEAVRPELVPTHFVVTMPGDSDDVALRGDIADLPGVLRLSSIRCGEAAPPAQDGAPPTVAVAVTERGRVVVVDTASGEVVRDLGGFDDPTDPEVANREGGPFSITGVALHPNGRDVYLETCCEPAAGAIYRVPIDGSVSIDASRLAPVAYGYGMDISADGRWLAYVSSATVSVMDLETGDVPYTAESGDGSHDWVQAAINADGTVLAIERALERSTTGEVLRSGARTTNLTTGEYEELPVDGGRFVPIWILGGTTLASAPAPGSNPRDSNVDAAGDWILEVTEDGRLVGRSEEQMQIPGGPYLAADW